MDGIRGLFGAGLILGMACTGPKLVPPGGPGDAGSERPPTPAECNCRLEGQGASATLTMSWDCFCDRFGCEGRLATDCHDHQERVDYPMCGLTVVQSVPAGGPIGSVYDWQGSMVGGFLASDTSPYACPSDPTIQALKVRAGTFPSAGCQARNCGMCSSLDPACLPLDAGNARDGGDASTGGDGSIDPGECQCRVEGTNEFNSVLWMSLPCFCARFGCGDYRAICEANPDRVVWERIEHPACGLTVLRWFNDLIDAPNERVFDSSGTVVGGMATGDTLFSCPSNRSLAGAQVRAGQFPAPECQGKNCGPCTAPDPSCGAADGATD